MKKIMVTLSLSLLSWPLQGMQKLIPSTLGSLIKNKKSSFLIINSQKRFYNQNSDDKNQQFEEHQKKIDVLYQRGKELTNNIKSQLAQLGQLTECDCYSEEVRKKAVLTVNTMNAWKYCSEIAGKLEFEINTTDIEENDWIVAAPKGRDHAYPHDRVLKFAHKKGVFNSKLHRILAGNTGIDVREGNSLKSLNKFFELTTDNNKITFSSRQNPHDLFSLGVTIGAQKPPIKRLTTSDSWPEIYDTLMRSGQSLHECLNPDFRHRLISLNNQTKEDAIKPLEFVSLSSHGYQLLAKLAHEPYCVVWSVEDITSENIALAASNVWHERYYKFLLEQEKLRKNNIPCTALTIHEAESIKKLYGLHESGQRPRAYSELAYVLRFGFDATHEIGVIPHQKHYELMEYLTQEDWCVEKALALSIQAATK